MVDTIWPEFLKIIREEVGSRTVETWFKAVTLKSWSIDQKEVYLEVPNGFVKDWISTHYLVLCQTHLGRLLNIEMPKVTITDARNFQSENNLVKVATPMAPASFEKSKFALVKAPVAQRSGYTNVGYTFDNFIVGPSNSLAYAAARAITERPGELYNPLFMYGSSGLGKTHLLHAIGNSIKAQHKKSIVLYQTADRFVSEFISAIRFNKMHSFEEKYQKADVLLIDDVQFISGKDQTQEAFFHIFNILHDARKQIVFSSDTVPQNIHGIAERLRSRLAWGLVTDIYTPSLETKVAILKKKAEQSNEVISDEIAHFIASHAVSNIRELEGALVRVIAFASLTGQLISLELAHKVLLRPVTESTSKSVDFKRIVQCLQKYYPYDLSALCSKDRNREVTFARHVAIFLIKRLTNKSLRDIGLFLGGRDHSTIMHAFERIDNYMQKTPEFSAKIKLIEQEILR